MRLPSRITVPTCIGCGAISRFGTCDRGCREQKLELVPAGQHDRLMVRAADARARAEVFRPVVEQLATRHPGPDEYENAYRSVQQAARIALRRHPSDNTQDQNCGEAAEVSTTWWCPGCDGIDAPQPRLGICIWHQVEWMNAARYEQERTRALSERETEQRLRLFLRLVASVTPRDDQWQAGWRALGARARRALQDRDERANPVATSR